MAVASETMHEYVHYGAASDLFWYRTRELLLAGPAGTGKSRACLEKLHACLQHYDGARGLMARATLTSLTAAALVTYETEVLKPWDGVTFFGGSKREPAQYRYPNGSVAVVGGLDNSDKVMSTQYDLAYVQEATEISEKNWEDITTRLRNHKMPYQQLIADCNPQEPTHWLKLRCDRGQTRMLHSRHEDNPTVTEEYLATLRALTGVRRARLYEGIWAAAEGVVYEEFNDRLHVVDAPPRPTVSHIAAQDWGFSNPGSLGVWAIDGDGRMTLVVEHYMTGKTMEWWIPRAQELHREFRFTTLACDPAEPGFIEQYQRARLPAVKAFNAIAPGIGAVKRRFAVAGDGLPRLMICRDALRERDASLVAAHKPFCTVQEIPGYVWPKGVDGKPAKETPVDESNHGLDMTRYACALMEGLGVERPEHAMMPAFIGVRRGGGRR